LSVTGNGSPALLKMIEQLSTLSSGEWKPAMTKSLAAESIGLIKNCFITSTTPYGEPWEPVERGGMPLRDTGRLMNAFQDQSTIDKIEISNPTVYANLQNYGGVVRAKNGKYLKFKTGSGRNARWAQVPEVTIKPRQFIPDERGLPDRWLERLTAVAELVFNRYFRGPA